MTNALAESAIRADHIGSLITIIPAGRILQTGMDKRVPLRDWMTASARRRLLSSSTAVG
ncbi:hypothetical protein I553_9014 [Mycobacterium xenopi 4042]|uniref:Uncharacterized protein n=1 Tax=Mycobacterium xenopi 4042 TaxID=1299334 RepID=X8AP18_MYCXE|nr:hypothetical protein I552_3775 [Mycobacterium xenopi 3993]EUA32876.1 hypothetical protein I553_9014 [Mycobacterium xenopi 4042]